METFMLSIMLINTFVATLLMILTCPCMFITRTVLVLLHTTNCSGFLGITCTELTVMSVATLPTDGLNVWRHSVVFIFHSWWQKEIIILHSHILKHCYSAPCALKVVHKRSFHQWSRHMAFETNQVEIKWPGHVNKHPKYIYKLQAYPPPPTNPHQDVCWCMHTIIQKHLI